MQYDEFDYRAMFAELGFDTRSNQPNPMTRCPYHKDQTPSMSINFLKGLYNCFSCGRSGNIATLYRKEKGHFYQPTAQDTTKRNFSINLPKLNLSSFEDLKKITFKALLYPYLDKNIMYSWLTYRGIKPEVATDARVQYGLVKITYKDEFGRDKSYDVPDRISFPIFNEKGELSSLEMRYPFFAGNKDKTIRKCLYPKGSCTNMLYDESRLNVNKKLYVLEGLMDCLAFRSLTGIKNSTSIFGAAVTGKQLRKLERFPEICYVYNNDKAGLASVRKVAESLQNPIFTTLAPTGTYDDVGEMAIAKFTGVEEWLKTEKTWNNY